MQLAVRALVLFGALGGVAGGDTPATAQSLHKARLATEQPRYMRVFGTALPPHGFVKFCERTPTECQIGPPELRRFELTADRRKLLDQVNRGVNRAVRPATDQEIYGVSEYWTMPTERGDCEDYALLKRHLLMREGWPASTLLMTVVRDEKGEGHAILTVRTAQGDFLLDNKNDDIRPWAESPYEFVMRQSYINPRIWMSLDPNDATIPGNMAGLDRAR